MPAKPKDKCCGSKPRCTRCPIRMRDEGTLPPGYTVRRRRLVKDSSKAGKKTGRKAKKAA